MADNRTSQLLSASFKGVPFNVRSENTSEAGRKIILHEYVNSSERFVEDQGQIPPKFSIRAFVHGADFLARAGRLEQALNEKGSGRLSMPTFGVIEAFAGAYTKDASQQSVGEIFYTIPFYTGRPAAGPSRAQTSIEDVYQLGDNARAAIGEELSSFYPPPQTSANSVVASSDLINILSDIENTIKTVLSVDDLEGVLSIIDLTKLNVPVLIRDAATLGDALFAGKPSFEGMWQQISVALSQNEVIGKGISILSLLTNLGGGLSLSLTDVQRGVSTDPESPEIALWPATTKVRIERNTARQNISQSNRIASLVGLYEVIAGKDYQTDVDISDARSAAEDLHERIMRVESSDRTLIQSNTFVRNAVEDIRIAALDVLEQKEQEAFAIQDDETGFPTSAFVRSYALYAEQFTDAESLSDRAVQIAKLNTSLSSASLVGSFKVFQVPNV